MTTLDEIKQHYGAELHICTTEPAPFARDTNADFQWLVAEVERLHAFFKGRHIIDGIEYTDGVVTLDRSSSMARLLGPDKAR